MKQTLRLLDLHTGESRDLAGGLDVKEIAVHPRGEAAFVVTAGSSGPRSLMISSSGQQSPFAPVEGEVEEVAWSPSGDALAFSNSSGNERAMYIAAPDGSGAVKAAAAGHSLEWSADGSLLSADSGAVAAVIDRAGNSVATLGTAVADGGVQWTPDGRLVFSERRWGSGDVILISDLQGRAVEIGEGHSATMSPDGSRVAFIRDNELFIAGADGTWETQVTYSMQPASTSPVWLSDEELLFGFAPGPRSIYVIDADGSNMFSAAEGRYPVWSHDGRSIAFAGVAHYGFNASSDGISVVDLTTGDIRLVGWSPHDDVGFCPGLAIAIAWSWDDHLLTYQRDRYESDSRFQGEVAVARPGWFSAQSFIVDACEVAWSPNSWRVAIAGFRDLWIADAQTGELLRWLKHGQGPAWSPDGKMIAYFSRGDGGTLEIVDASSGNVIRSVSAPPGGWSDMEGPPSWSPAGDQIAYTSGGRVHVVTVATGEVRELAWGSQPAWSPAGDAIAFMVEEGGWWESKIYVISPDGGPLEYLVDGRDPAWSPDGTRLAFTR